MSTEDKSLRVIEFSGKRADWDAWSTKFLARASRKGYLKLLTGKGVTAGVDKIPTLAEYELAVLGSSDDDKKIAKVGELNSLAFEDIVLSINATSAKGKVAFSLVKNCKSDDFPEGNSRLAWDRMKRKYQPHTVPSLLKLEKQFINCRLENVDEDPEDWISKLETIRNEIENVPGATKKTDRDFLIHVLNNLPVEYDLVTIDLEKKLMNTGSGALTIEETSDALGARYSVLHERSTDVKKRDKALAAFMKQFKGMCRNCGKYGHKSSDCPDRKDGERPATAGTQASTVTSESDTKKRKFRGQCWSCGKYGHTKMECPKLQNMANQALDAEDADVSSSDSESELALVAADLHHMSLTSKNRNNFCTQKKKVRVVEPRSQYPSK